MKGVYLYLEEEQYKKLKELSKKTQAPVSAIVRKMLKTYLKRVRA
ncbi:MAG: ribbon-helix-helix domain-containing protein [Thermoproteota archaeon]|jgi:predicted DNA-binding protein